jgi:hypothetical protein
LNGNCRIVLRRLLLSCKLQDMTVKSAAQKLGLKPGGTLYVKSAPSWCEDLLGPLPAGASLIHKTAGQSPMILVFAKDRAAMIRDLPQCKAKLEVDGVLWIAYAKGTSKKASDINRDTIREYAASIGLDTVAQIAIDGDWSALRLKSVG